MTTSTIVEETLWPEQETRKIPVDRLYCDYYRPASGKNDGHANYGIVFTPGSKRTHRKEFASLRKEISEFHKIYPYGLITTKGEEWSMPKDALLHFADRMEIPGDLDALMKRSVDEYEERERERKRREKEEEEQYFREMEERRVPCTSPCKIRVQSIECDGEDTFRQWVFNRIFSSHERSGTYKIKLAESATSEEREAHELFCKAMLKAQEDKTERGITGSWRDWTFNEYTLLHYSDWLEFPGPNDGIENVIKRAKAEYETRQNEEYKRWYEERSTDDGYFGRFFGARSQSQGNVRQALQVFGVDAEYVKKQYRILAKQTHPDTGGDAEQFKRVNEAYEVLKAWIGDEVSA